MRSLSAGVAAGGRRGRALGLSAACLAALTAALLGCEDLPRSATPEVPLWVHHPGGTLSVFLRRELTSPSRKVGEPYERGRPAIDATHRRVFVGSADGGLYALSAVRGATLWRFETAGAVQSEPLYEPREDAVYFGSNDGSLYKLRASDGRLEWRFFTRAEITRQPVLHRGVLYATNANDTLLAIDPARGAMLWYRHRTPAFGMEISGYAGPAAHEDLVYAAFSDGVVMAYDARDGAEKWRPVDLNADVEQLRPGGELRYLDVDTTPVVARIGGKDRVFVASYEGGVHALDARTGMRVWGNDGVTGVTELVWWQAPARPGAWPEGGLGNEGAVASSQEGGGAGDERGAGIHRMLVASSGLSGLWGLDPEDGSALWHRDLPAGGITAAAAVSRALLIGTTRYGVFLVSPLDGGIIDGLHSGGSFAGAPAGYGTRAFILSNEGVLFGLHAQPPTPSG